MPLGAVYQQAPRETSFGASPPPDDDHIRYVQGFDMSDIQEAG